MNTIRLLMLMVMVETAVIVGLLRMLLDLLDSRGAPGSVIASLKAGSAWAFCATLTLLTVLLTWYRSTGS
ncbi:hypothetical protein ACIPYS_19895 [Kitasatospora sp. NPDC089913]|uniref:hypothetical protein n=1 Tax=Kitasatospora sp. NPDC089913 TaxID=3364080 RepID=UPI0038067508